MRKFSAFDTAIKMRNIMRLVADDRIRRAMPPDAFAVVDTIDMVNRLAYVFYPGETTSAPVNFWQVVPTAAGQVVRITGPASDRYICDLQYDNWHYDFETNVAQGATNDIAHTVRQNEWKRSGSEVTWNFWLDITGSGTGSQPVSVLLPVPTAETTALAYLGTAMIWNNSVPRRYVCAIETAGLTSGTRAYFAGDDVFGGVYGQSGVVEALASSDQIRGSARYRVA